jgi:hypothetical protein
VALGIVIVFIPKCSSWAAGRGVGLRPPFIPLSTDLRLGGEVRSFMEGCHLSGAVQNSHIITWTVVKPVCRLFSWTRTVRYVLPSMDAKVPELSLQGPPLYYWGFTCMHCFPSSRVILDTKFVLMAGRKLCTVLGAPGKSVGERLVNTARLQSPEELVREQGKLYIMWMCARRGLRGQSRLTPLGTEDKVHT